MHPTRSGGKPESGPFWLGQEPGMRISIAIKLARAAYAETGVEI